MTVLKPLYGDEPLLKVALASICQQAYPAYQVLFGVGSETDTAVPVVQALQRRFPQADIDIVVDSTPRGPNGKVGNLINTLPYAKHDVLVIADSDVHAAPDLLIRLAEALSRPNAGLATVLYAGCRPFGSLICRLGAMQITHTFLPGALLARRMGRQDCLGATMALRRSDLTRIGGFEALVGHLADDAVLGRRIRALSLDVVLADSVVLTTVPEKNLGALFRHELRWARTIRGLAATGFAASILQVLVVLGAVSHRPDDLAVVVRPVRSRLGRTNGDRCGPGWWYRAKAAPGRRAAGREALTYAVTTPVWLLPVRDILSVAVLLASFTGPAG